MDDGFICLEFIKSRNGKEKILEVFRISADGSVVSFILTSLYKYYCETYLLRSDKNSCIKLVTCFNIVLLQFVFFMNEIK